MPYPARDLSNPVFTCGHSRLAVGTPLLAGSAEESIFPRLTDTKQIGAFSVCRHGEWLLGQAQTPLSPDLEAATQLLYKDLLTASAGYSLCRIWNYLPAINKSGTHGEENYRLFCLARSQAIESVLGLNFPQNLPAASAVGTDNNSLSVLFAAHSGRTCHFENPEQVPAYYYPPEHGPRSPSFARATVLTSLDSKTIFISGTASIKGHKTSFPNDTSAQLDCTLDNLRLISATCGLGNNLAAEYAIERHFKVYLRHAADLDFVQSNLVRTLLLPSDQVSYLRSDICRADLTLEIEASIFTPLT
ncbi:MAG: hypothetical protein WCO60_17150 [Verrucomicrobiota bacterium]